MGANYIIMLKKTCLLLIILLMAAVFSTSFAGRALVHTTLGKEVDATPHEKIQEDEISHHEDDIIHERLLRMNTKDYGRYDPAPAFVKPPFKLIPN